MVTSNYTNMFSPTLALDIELEDVTFPCMVQEKYNGVRFEKLNGLALTRTLKPIPNDFIRCFIEDAAWDNVEGEILVHGATTVNEVTSAVMSKDGTPDFYLKAFDIIDHSTWLYKDRYNHLLFRVSNEPNITPADFWLCDSLTSLKVYTQGVQDKGGEGVIIRYNLPYKNGRSTKGHPGLLRHVPHAQATATILACEELMSNENEQFTDELGRTKRSKHQANLIPQGTLGAILVQCDLFLKPFRVGTGFTAIQRDALWYHRDKLINEQLIFEYKPSTVIEVPAPAVFKRLV